MKSHFIVCVRNNKDYVLAVNYLTVIMMVLSKMVSKLSIFLFPFTVYSNTGNTITGLVAICNSK